MVPGPSATSTRTARELGASFLLLLTSLVAQRLVPVLLETVSRVVVVAFDRQTLGAVVYTTLAVSALGVAAVARRRLDGSDPLALEERIQIGGTATLVLLVGTYWLHRTADLPVFPADLLEALMTGLVAMGAVALGYVRIRGVDVPLGLPDRTAYPMAGASVGLAALVGGAWLAVFVATNDVLLRFAGGTGFGIRFSTGDVIWDAAVPAVFLGVGSGLLYSGGVQEPLRERVGPTRAVAAATAVVGATIWTFRELAQFGTTASTAVSLTAVALLSVLAAGLTIAVTGLVLDLLDVTATAPAGAVVGVLVVAVPLATAGLFDARIGGFAAFGISYTAAAAIAAHGYERTRSVWVPAVTFAAYMFVVDTSVAATLARVLV